jgi:hypothetical protein
MSSDRTQTLSVELERQFAEIIANAPGSLSQEQAIAWSEAINHMRDQCRTALSQPEQGETPSLVLSDEDQPEHPGEAAGEGEDAVEAIHRVAIEAELDDLDQTTLAEWASLLTALGAEGWQLVHATALPAAVLSEPSAAEQINSPFCICGKTHSEDVQGLGVAPRGLSCRPLTWREVAEQRRDAANARRAEAKRAEAALYEATWNYYEGLAKANEDAAKSCREKAAALRGDSDAR